MCTLVASVVFQERFGRAVLGARGWCARMFCGVMSSQKELIWKETDWKIGHDPNRGTWALLETNGGWGRHTRTYTSDRQEVLRLRPNSPVQ